MPSSAVPSIVTPSAIAMARSSNPRCTESGDAEPSSRDARSKYGSAAEGRQGFSAARAESMSAAYPLT